MSKKPKLPKITEPDEGMVHYAAPFGLDQVTLCGITDWIGATRGEETSAPVTCWHCQTIARHFIMFRNDVA